MDSIKDRLPAALQTERLVLTHPTSAHAPDIARLANNRRIHDVMARLPFPYSLADAHFFLEQVAPSPAESCYAILHDGVFMGIVGLSYAAGRLPELGYWLGEPYWGQGFATEAGARLVAAARATGIAGLQSRALVTNAGSRNVLRKLGFIETGEDIDQLGTLAGRAIMRMRLDFPAGAAADPGDPR